MSEVRWCWTHDERIHDACPSAEWQDGMCDVRDAVVLPKGDYLRKLRPDEIPHHGIPRNATWTDGWFRKVEV